MKNIRFVYCFFLALITLNSLQAQNATEAQKKAIQNAMAYGKNKVDVSQIPDKYSFSWKYTMEIKTESGKAMNVDYMLEPNALYYGANMNQSASKMFMIMDTKNKLMVNSFDKGAKKMAMASKIQDYNAINTTKNEKYTYKKLPNKTILGYNCKGMQATNTTSNITFYYTTEAKVSFANIFKSNQNGEFPDLFKDFLKPNEKPLLMEMNYKDLKNKNKTTSMKCLSLNKESYIFNKSDYKFM